MKTTLTVWNKTIQALVEGDDTNILLAFLLCNDKASLMQWNWLERSECTELGLPYLGSPVFQNIKWVAAIKFNELYLKCLMEDHYGCVSKLKQKL